METWETPVLGILGPGDKRLCMRLLLHVHYRPFSVTSEDSLKDSAGDFMRSECVKLVLVSFNTHALSSYINVCAGYMCFPPLNISNKFYTARFCVPNVNYTLHNVVCNI